MIGRDYSRLVQSCGRKSECLNLEERTERTHYGWANVEATKKDTAKVWICVPWPVLPGHTRDFATRVVAGRAGHGHPSSSFSLAFRQSNLETEWNRDVYIIFGQTSGYLLSYGVKCDSSNCLVANWCPLFHFPYALLPRLSFSNGILEHPNLQIPPCRAWLLAQSQVLLRLPVGRADAAELSGPTGAQSLRGSKQQEQSELTTVP